MMAYAVLDYCVCIASSYWFCCLVSTGAVCHNCRCVSLFDVSASNMIAQL